MKPQVDMSLTAEILSQIPGDPISGLHRVDRLWQSIKEQSGTIPQIVHNATESLAEIEFDVVVCGGTLGILIASALAQRGYRVAVIERGVLRGRTQEWNISRQELQVFLELELLTTEELERAIVTEYNPARVQFLGGSPIWVKDILNTGVDPIDLLETLKQKFLKFGGKLLENTPFQQAVIHPNGVSLQTGFQSLTTRLLIDAMGHFSPIVQQVRHGEKPDGVCLVVGSCATGISNHESGDLIVTFTPIQHQCQYFWEAFPAKDGRTTYLFTYLDADPKRFSLEFLFEEYLRLLPEYQQVELKELQFKRVLFGLFPSYQKTPLKMPWNRVLPIGDSSGNSSPVSFGGFGAMIRHLKRLTEGIEEALKLDLLDAQSLQILQPYQPNLAVTRLFQKAMTVGIEQKLDPQQINRLLAQVFRVMESLGDGVIRPFLQDVVQFPALTQTLLKTAFTQPSVVFPVIPQVGIEPLLNWTGHYLNLAFYSNLFDWNRSKLELLNSISSQREYEKKQRLMAWKYGSGQDYHSFHL